MGAALRPDTAAAHRGSTKRVARTSVQSYRLGMADQVERSADAGLGIPVPTAEEWRNRLSTFSAQLAANRHEAERQRARDRAGDDTPTTSGYSIGK